MDPDSHLTPEDELMTSLQVLTYIVHRIAAYEDGDTIRELNAIFEKETETERDIERFHEIAAEQFERYGKIIGFDRLDFVPDENPEVSDLLQRMKFLAISDHISEMELKSFASEREDPLAHFIELGRKFLQNANNDFHAAFEDLDHSIGEREEIFLQCFYFDDVDDDEDEETT